MILTVVPAVIGTLAGWFYAELTLDPETFSRLAGMYAAAGAASAVLILRLATIFTTILSDYFQKND